MGRASRARRIASAAAYGGGGAVTFAGGTLGLLVAQARWARRRVGDPPWQPFVVDGLYGPLGRIEPRLSGDPLRLVVLGDSAAAGLGAEAPDDTPGALLAAGLAALSGRPVRLDVLAVVGAQTAAVLDQVQRALPLAPDAVAVVVGANDVTHATRPQVSVRHLEDAVSRLRTAGVGTVVVGTCPDLGTVRPIPQPLRQIGRQWSRTLAAAQAIATVEAGGRAVSLTDLLGPEFHARPGELFSEDRFHPSSLGYRRIADALLPTLAAALGYGPAADAPPDPARGERIAPLAELAARAADEAGTELAGAVVAGAERGSAGRWGALRRRVRLRRSAAASIPTVGGPPNDSTAPTTQEVVP